MRTAGLLILCCCGLGAASVPMTLLSEDEAEPIHSAILRKEPWTVDAVRRLRAEADKRLHEGPWSVTTDRPVDATLDPHDFYGEAPFWWPDPANPAAPWVHREGQINPNRSRADKLALDATCDSIFTLGAASFFLDDPRYGRHATHLINAWFLNPKTRMNPNLEYSQAVRGLNEARGGTIEGRVFIRAVQGMEFLTQSGQWDAREAAATHKWFEDYLRWLTHSKTASDEKSSGNPRASWWTAQVAAIATFLDDKATAQMAFNYYRDSVFPRQIGGDVIAPHEEERARTLTYSAFNAEGMATTCRIAQAQGVDLWGTQGKGGATLATVIAYLAPHLADRKKWDKGQIAEFETDGIYFLAFAGMGMKKPEYVALYHQLEHADSAWLSFVDLMAGRWEAAAHQTRH
ncbi:MAG: alginate lyase family protein [Bryobacteraceae bacterium]